MNSSGDCQEEPDNTGKGKPSITGSLRDPELEPVNAIVLPVEQLDASHKSALEIDSNASSLKMDIQKENRIGNRPPSEHHIMTAEVSHPQIDKRELNKVVDASELDNTSTDDSKIYVVELSLKRLRDLRESGITCQDDRNVLRRSELSAFSRYNSSSNLTRTPNGITRSNSLIENSLETAKNNPVHDIEARMSRSASGSNHGSNGQTGSSNAVNAGGTHGNSDTALAGTSRSGDDASCCGSGNTMDSFKLVRAAALTKFRQKRKERCFEKKVRYQNRKKLAEQRPRVRGQFVRKIEQNNPTNTADE